MCKEHFMLCRISMLTFSILCLFMSKNNILVQKYEIVDTYFDLSSLNKRQSGQLPYFSFLYRDFHSEYSSLETCFTRFVTRGTKNIRNHRSHGLVIWRIFVFFYYKTNIGFNIEDPRGFPWASYAYLQDYYKTRSLPVKNDGIQ